jgi:hypothetical protein
LSDELVPKAPEKRAKKRVTGREGMGGQKPRAKREFGKEQAASQTAPRESVPKEVDEPTSETKAAEEKE